MPITRKEQFDALPITHKEVRDALFLSYKWINGLTYCNLQEITRIEFIKRINLLYF